MRDGAWTGWKTQTIWLQTIPPKRRSYNKIKSPPKDPESLLVVFSMNVRISSSSLHTQFSLSPLCFNQIMF